MVNQKLSQGLMFQWKGHWWLLHVLKELFSMTALKSHCQNQQGLSTHDTFIIIKAEPATA